MEMIIDVDVYPTVIINVAPQYWTMNRSTVEAIIVSVFIYGILAFILGEVKGHFRKKENFDSKEAEEYESALNQLIYLEQGSEYYPQCYLFWVGNWTHTLMTLLDIITDVIYIQTITKYSDALGMALQVFLVIPFLVLLVGSFWMAIRARGNACVKFLYFFKAVVASFTGNIHILSQLEEHSYDTNREKYINGLVLAIL